MEYWQIIDEYHSCVSQICIECSLYHFDPFIVCSASLLKERKVNPTEKWVKELPYKARKLEEQLYRTASSLEAYLDKSTLKHRLKTVAHAITSQFRLAKDGRKKTQSGMNKRSGPVAIPSDLSIPLISSVTNNNLSVPQFDSLTQPRSGADSNQNLLQEQILENIRQQQLIMKSLMMSQGQSQIGNLQHIPMGDVQNSMTGFGQPMHGGQMNNMNVNVENMLLLQQAHQLGYNGAGLNMNNVGNSLSSQQLSMMNSMGLGFGMGSSGLSSTGLGLTNGMHGMMGVNQLNGMNSIPMYQNQQMMRNSFTDGSPNVSSLMAMTQASITDNAIQGPPMMSGMHSGVHPTMPPPMHGASGRTSFTNGSRNAGMADENLNLSPSSFNW